VEALRKKERQDETQFTTKIDGFLSFIIPSWMLMYYFFAGLFLNLTLCMTKLKVPVLSFPDFTDISSVLELVRTLFFWWFKQGVKSQESNVLATRALSVHSFIWGV
jgi:hypothetical protein